MSSTNDDTKAAEPLSADDEKAMRLDSAAWIVVNPEDGPDYQIPVDAIIATIDALRSRLDEQVPLLAAERADKARLDHLEAVRRHAEDAAGVLGVNDGHDPDHTLAIAAERLVRERDEAVAMAERVTREADSLRDQLDAATLDLRRMDHAVRVALSFHPEAMTPDLARVLNGGGDEDQ